MRKRDSIAPRRRCLCIDSLQPFIILPLRSLPLRPLRFAAPATATPFATPYARAAGPVARQPGWHTRCRFHATQRTPVQSNTPVARYYLLRSDASPRPRTRTPRHATLAHCRSPARRFSPGRFAPQARATRRMPAFRQTPPGSLQPLPFARLLPPALFAGIAHCRTLDSTCAFILGIRPRVAPIRLINTVAFVRAMFASRRHCRYKLM